MKTMRTVLLAVIAIVLLLVACSAAPPASPAPPIELGIHATPRPYDYRRSVLTEIPSYNPSVSNSFQVDLRHYDLRKADLKNRLYDLLHADFDGATQWPEELPDGFEPEKWMELGKNPGLGVRGLQEQGVTGKGVGIAIIDQTLLVDHVEYKERLRHYEELGPDAGHQGAAMHGAAVASIAVGKSIGVATEADLYFICPEWVASNGQADFTKLAEAVDRIVAINEQLPKERKIRVLSMSIGWGSDSTGYREIVKAVNNAKKQGIFVVSSSLSSTYKGLFFHGLGRDPGLDPEDPNSYGPGSWWAVQYYQTGSIARGGGEALLIPMDSRTTAGFTSDVSYSFYAEGGWSWCAPYIAGLYAMACQVKPDVTPESFWKEALATGDTVTLSMDGRTYEFGKIVNPPKLIDALKKPN